MKAAGKLLNWRIGFALGTLVYVAWVLPLGLHDFEKVHRDYRETARSLRPARSRAIARQELIDQCRREAMGGERFPSKAGKVAAGGEVDCLSWPPSVIEERRLVVEERLIAERSRAGRKLGLFYFTFVVIFLVLPPFAMYLWLAALIRIFRRTGVIK